VSPKKVLNVVALSQVNLEELLASAGRRRYLEVVLPQMVFRQAQHINPWLLHTDSFQNFPSTVLPYWPFCSVRANMTLNVEIARIELSLLTFACPEVDC
jgi:hypothetical protein